MPTSDSVTLGDLVQRGADPNVIALIDCHDVAKPRDYTHGDIDAAAYAVARGLVLEMWTPALMPGYHHLPERTAAAMTDDGYYITGDIMRRDANGFYEFVGHADDMFVCSGENIYPGEVEQMLERHPAIHQRASYSYRMR